MDFESIKESLIVWGQSSGLQVLIIILGGWVAQIVIAKFSRRVLNSVITSKFTSSRSDTGRDKRISTLHQVLVKTSAVFIFLAVVLMVFVEMGINITPILTGAGILGIAVGFGAQDIVKNLFHGIFILLEDQYSEGDVVSLAGISGTVEEFDLRRTVLRDLDGTQHHIPNGEITVSSNKTKGWSNIHMNIGIGYSTDLKKITEVVNNEGSALQSAHANVIEPPRLVGVEEFGDSAIIVKIIGKVQPGHQWELSRELRRMLKEAFERENIEIPFPHQVEIHKSE